VLLPVAVGDGAFITATATHVATGNTSEFSACLMAESGALVGDFDNDGLVDASDLALLLGSWGPCPPQADCPADLNADGVVNAADLAMLLGNWG